MNKSKIKAIISSTITAISTNRMELAKEIFFEGIRGLDTKELQELSGWITRNEAAYIYYEFLSDFDSPKSREMARLLEREARLAVERASYTLSLLEEATRVFEKNHIKYTVFKTFNKIGRIDVDIDIIIPVVDYTKAIRSLLENDFVLIDDVTKYYATGLMKPGNPIILDLHTELTVLGVPYIDSKLLLDYGRYSEFRLPGDQYVSTRYAAPTVDTAVRIAHSLVKEALIKLDDITETLENIIKYYKNILDMLRDNGLERAFYYFQYYLNKIMLAWDIPHSLPRIISVSLLIDRIYNKNMYLETIKLINNLKYKRSAAQLGKLIFLT